MPTPKLTNIALTESSARMLYWLLADERLRLLDERRYAHAAGAPLTSYQSMTAQIRAVRGQLLEAAEREGWDLGSPEYENR